MPGDPAKRSLISGSGHAFLLGAGLACGVSETKSLRWQHKAISGASAWEQIGGWRDGSGLEFVSIGRAAAAPASKLGEGRGVGRTTDRSTISAVA